MFSSNSASYHWCAVNPRTVFIPFQTRAIINNGGEKLAVIQRRELVNEFDVRLARAGCPLAAVAVICAYWTVLGSSSGVSETKHLGSFVKRLGSDPSSLHGP